MALLPLPLAMLAGMAMVESIFSLCILFLIASNSRLRIKSSRTFVPQDGGNQEEDAGDEGGEGEAACCHRARDERPHEEGVRTRGGSREDRGRRCHLRRGRQEACHLRVRPREGRGARRRRREVSAEAAEGGGQAGGRARLRAGEV